ncbi:MAG: hypothetical protein OQJ89_04420 [Kangiellaceae bacterium]|nr:hypothetical protein [Kangiellaceae bacterium]MCW8997241.1 hypothetical protein [Kangiellaceae bacterium]MCW9016187.1 hypothetical protein [Kangiellaceae bacterium]
MKNVQSPIQIATPLTELKPTPITRPVTSRENKLIEQINYLKEKLLLSEMAMDEKDIQITNLLKTNNSNQKFILSFDQRLKKAQSRDGELRNKFDKLRATAQKASKIARDKHERLACIETELDRYQQEILVANRIQAQLMDLVIKNAPKKDTSPAVESILKGGFALPFKRRPQSVHNYLDQNKSPLINARQSLNKVTDKVKCTIGQWLDGSDLFSDIEERLSRVNLSKKVSRASKEKIQAKATLPKIHWRNVKQILPPKTGMYYVTDGNKVEIAMFDFENQQFKRTDSNMPIDFWCAPKRKKI